MGRPEAPEIDHPYVFSVSQIETFNTCPRKWAYYKIDGLEQKQNKWAKLGNDCHDMLENFLGKGVPIRRDSKVGKIVFPGLKYLPPPLTPGMRVEKWFAITFGSAAYRGLKDVEIPYVGELPFVLDHKTTRNFEWKKDKAALLQDTQSGIYAADAMAKTGKDRVRLRWVYYRTEGAPHAEPTDAIITKPQVEKILQRTEQTARKMIKVLRTCSSAAEVTPDYTGCSAFGGCPYRDEYCKPKPNQRLQAIMAQKSKKDTEKDTDDFLAEFASRGKKNKSEGSEKKGKKGKKEKKEKKGKKSKKKGNVSVDDVQQINSPDRKSAKKPPPPPAKMIEGDWVQPVWDEDAFDWVYPGEEEEKKKKKKKKGKGKGKKKSMEELTQEVLDEDEEDDEEDDEDEDEDDEAEEDDEEDDEDEDEEDEDDEDEDDEPAKSKKSKKSKASGDTTEELLVELVKLLGRFEEVLKEQAKGSKKKKSKK